MNSVIRSIIKELEDKKFQFEIQTRVKSVYSIYKKMKELSLPFDEIYDLCAIRIILSSCADEEKSACWAVYSIISNHYKPCERRLRDWITIPKKNGYESLHTAIMKDNQWIEIQIRTERMNHIAEKGYAAHCKYKDVIQNNQGESKMDILLDELKDILKNRDKNISELLNDFRNNIYIDEIRVFTSKGKIKIFPKGATIVDFAYQISPEKGHYALVGKVNKQLVPLRYKLQSGDQVEIIIISTPQVSIEWLNYSITSIARNKIKNYLDKNSQIFQIKIKKKNQFPTYESSIHKNKFSKSQGEYEIIVGHKSDIPRDMNCVLSDCCRPFPNDFIFGFLVSKETIEIHRAHCPAVISLITQRKGDIIKAVWREKRNRKFDFHIFIEGIEKGSVIQNLMHIVKDNKVIVKDKVIQKEEKLFKISFIFSSESRNEMNRLMENIKNIEGVYKVNRNESLMIMR